MTVKILFGTAGVPHSSPERSSVAGVRRVKELGLDAMELEFVRGVHMSRETAEEVKKAADEINVRLSVHAPYYINLNSKEVEKRKASVKRIYDSARVGYWAGAKIVTFHPAYYHELDSGEVLDTVEKQLRELLEKLKHEKIEIVVAPETCGKKSQFGSLEETLELCRRLKKLRPMVDFSHLHARCNGCLGKKEDFLKQLDLIGDINKDFLDELQMHVSGIEYGKTGERKHLNVDESDFKYRALMEALKEKKVSGTVICESPNIEEDALLMKKYYNSL